MMKNRRISVVFMILCLILTMMPSMAFAAEEKSDDIVILYTGDINGAVGDNLSLAGVAAYANDKLKDCGFVEIADTGDSLSGTATANSSQGKFAVEAMNAAGYGVCTAGVHDFDFGVDTLKELSAIAEFEYVSCNFTDTETGKTVFSPYYIKTYGQTKVAYVGISEPATMSLSQASFTNAAGRNVYSFVGSDGKSLYESVQTAVNSARGEGADYVIVIGHLTADSGALSPKSVIAATTGINAFIAGGSEKLVAGESVKNADGDAVLLTSAGARLENIGVLTLSPGKTLSSQIVTSYALRDISTKDTIDALTEKYNSQMKGVFAESKYKLLSANSDGIRTVGKSETNLGDLCADAFRAAAGADIAFVEARDIQSDIAVGDISYSDIVKVLPGNKSISVMEVSGYDILDALEMSARLYPSNNEGFLQISGLTFDIQETVKSTVTLSSAGKFTGVSRDYRVTNVKVGGKELDLLDRYTVAATAEFFAGNTGYTMFSEGKLKSAGVAVDNQALYDYIGSKLKGVIGDEYAKSAGRIDYIKLARQSEIDAQIEAGVTEMMKNYSEEMAELREQVAMQKEIIDIKTLTIKATSSVKKSGSKRSIKLSWTCSKSVDGLKYQVYKSQSKSSGYKKAFTTGKKTYTNSSGIKKGKRYYYKVRGYKYVNGKYYYTDWSNITYKKVS